MKLLTSPEAPERERREEEVVSPHRKLICCVRRTGSAGFEFLKTLKLFIVPEDFVNLLLTLAEAS